MKKRLVGHVVRAAINTVAVMGLVTFAAAGTGNAAPADSAFSWSSPNYVPGVGTSAAPSMAQCAQTAYMVWKGVADDEHLYYTSYTPGSGWAAQQQIALGNLTDTAPSVSCDSYPQGGNLMVVAWKGIGADQHVYTTSEGTGAGPTGWSAPQQVPGALTDTSPAAGMVPTDYIIPAVAKATSKATSKPASPRFTVPAVPYLAWKNAGSNSISSTSMVNGAWQAPAIVPGAFTDVAPTMSAVLGSTYQADLTWKVAGSTSMQYAVYDSANNAWSGPAYIGGGGGTSTGVATTHVEMGNSSNSSVTAHTSGANGAHDTAKARLDAVSPRTIHACRFDHDHRSLMATAPRPQPLCRRSPSPTWRLYSPRAEPGPPIVAVAPSPSGNAHSAACACASRHALIASRWLAAVAG